MSNSLPAAAVFQVWRGKGICQKKDIRGTALSKLIILQYWHLISHLPHTSHVAEIGNDTLRQIICHIPRFAS